MREGARDPVLIRAVVRTRGLGRGADGKIPCVTASEVTGGPANGTVVWATFVKGMTSARGSGAKSGSLEGTARSGDKGGAEC